jgi:hypothetical protein
MILSLLSNKYSQIALIVVVALVGLQLYGARQHSLGYSKAQSEYTQKALAASESARKRESDLQIQLQEAQNEARTRETALIAAADGARAERDGLRDELAAIGDRLSKASADSLRKYAATANNVLRECATRLTELAQKADRHASDSLMLQRAWPKP